MLNDVATFLREMPVSYYLSGGILSTREPPLAFFIGHEKIETLVAGVRAGVGYEGSVEKDNDAPPFADGQSRAGTVPSVRSLSRKLASRYRLRQNVKHLFIIDA